MPEREESHLVPGFEAPLGHLGDILGHLGDILGGAQGGTKKRTHFGVGFGAKKGSQNGSNICQKTIQKHVIFWNSFFGGLGALEVHLGSLLGLHRGLLGGLRTPKTLKN